MRVATCSVGAELLTGEIVDTNASWMAGRVLETGCRMTAVVVVGDDRGEIVEGLEWLGDRADVILVGGGLGPTSDDLTRYAVADFAGVGLERRSELVAHLEAVYARLDRAMPPDALRQADIPVGAEVHQPFGSAAGFVVDAERAGRSVRVHVLPGVPWEYQGIADRDVLPDLVRRSEGTARVTRTIHVAGAGESWIGNALRELTDRLESEPDVELGYRAKSDEVQVRITATAATPAAARERATAILDDAADRLGDRVTSVDGRQLEGLVAGLLRARGWTVATAETFTAGRLSAALSSTPEGLDRLRGGLVTPGPVDESGADDTETATRLADDVRRRFDADLGIAVTGAAPGDGTAGDRTAGDSTADDRAGTVTWAIAGPAADTLVDRAFINGDREIVRARAVAFVLEALRRRAGS